VYAVCDTERPGYYLMEAAEPLTLDRILFQDESMTELRVDRAHLLGSAMDKLANLHAVSFRPEEPTVARYHYLHRFQAIPRRDDFKRTYSALFDGGPTAEEVLASPVVIDGAYHCRSYAEQMAFLESSNDGFVQPTGAYLHGDVHLKNMLVDRDRRNVLFVDPRVVWDGHDVGDPGFGDPLYDYGTLLHSLHTMSAILHAIEIGGTEGLLHLEDRGQGDNRRLVFSAGSLRITDSATVDWFVDWLDRTVPARILGPNWRARLHLNTANALVGWLKYARALETAHAWMAVFASVLFHLEAARRLMEGRTRAP
jgi:hypothetical protein